MKKTGKLIVTVIIAAFLIAIITSGMKTVEVTLQTNMTLSLPGGLGASEARLVYENKHGEREKTAERGAVGDE